MRQRRFVVALVASACLVVAATVVRAQEVDARLEIRNVTLNAADGVVAISGTGFGEAPVVWIDGQRVDILAGSGDTQVFVAAPSSVLAVPGTYRLTVGDPTRSVSDDFVLAVPVPSAVVSTTTESAAAPTTAATSPFSRRSDGGTGR